MTEACGMKFGPAESAAPNAPRASMCAAVSDSSSSQRKYTH